MGLQRGCVIITSRGLLSYCAESVHLCFGLCWFNAYYVNAVIQLPGCVSRQCVL